MKTTVTYDRWFEAIESLCYFRDNPIMEYDPTNGSLFHRKDDTSINGIGIVVLYCDDGLYFHHQSGEIMYQNMSGFDALKSYFQCSIFALEYVFFEDGHGEIDTVIRRAERVLDYYEKHGELLTFKGHVNAA